MMQVLTSFDVDGVVEQLRKASNVVVMAGAGVSVSAGIPDFRTPGTGLCVGLHPPVYGPSIHTSIYTSLHPSIIRP